jgi:DNA (cytosine-5)-methyltransferase 1
MTKGSVVDLFCGAGGASLGFLQSDYEICGAVDIDADALDVYRKNLCDKDLDELPGSVTFDEPMQADLSREADDYGEYTTFEDIREYFDLDEGEVDVICGCPPCQNFSTLRDTTPWPDDEPKDKLLQAYVEFIREAKPDVVFFENVPNIIHSGNGDTTYSEWFKRQMEMPFDDTDSEVGYGVNLKVVNAADYGLPQRRRRTIGICKLGVPSEDIVFPAPTHQKEASSNDTLKKWVTVRDVLKPYYDNGLLKMSLELGKAQVGADDYPDDPAHRARRHQQNTIETMEAIREHGGSWSDLRNTDDEEYIRDCHQDLEGSAVSAYGIMDWDSPAPTLTTRCTTPSCGRYTHPEENRSITFREAALLMSFPDDYELPEKNSIAERVIGNAVPPGLVSKILDGYSIQTRSVV